LATFDTLPSLAGDAAERVAGWGGLGFLHLLAESARTGLRELDRLNAVAEERRGPWATNAHGC
jgi:hypothetical protein